MPTVEHKAITQMKKFSKIINQESAVEMNNGWNGHTVFKLHVPDLRTKLLRIKQILKKKFLFIVIQEFQGKKGLEPILCEFLSGRSWKNEIELSISLLFSAF